MICHVYDISKGQFSKQSINQAIGLRVQGKGADVTHLTSWLESTGERVWQQKAADQSAPQKTGSPQLTSHADKQL